MTEQYMTSKMMVAALLAIKEAVSCYLIREEPHKDYKPFEAKDYENESHAEFHLLEMLTVIPYDSSKELSQQQNKFNFKYKDLNIGWCCSLNSINQICWCESDKKYTNDDIEKMLEECLGVL